MRLLDWLLRRLRRHRHHKRPPTPPPPVPPPPPPVPVPPPTSGVIAWTLRDTSISAGDVQNWLAALNAQVADIRVLWPHVQEWAHVFVPAGQMPPSGSVPATIRPTGSGDPQGALGWHGFGPDQFFTGTGPYIVILSDTTVADGQTVSSVMSHEAGELTVDPSTTLTATAPDGSVWALEVGDPCQGSFYSINGVQVQDLVGQSFFDLGAGPVDKTGALTQPFTILPTGYAVVNGQPVFGERAPKWGDPDDRRPSHVPPPRRVT